ncbi:MAG TPA: dienelactone hydrolase family protein [Beijerinckiaceae bacterium]|nr:dienelactone hydrolase family protein [Beijerinckiaceae bacterium]
MTSEPVAYAVEGLEFEGRLIHSEAQAGAPLLLMAPNWLGISQKAIALGEELAAGGYVVFVVDMYGRDGRPTGRENPMEFLAPLLGDPAAARARVRAGFEAMTRTCDQRRIGDPNFRAAIGFCFGGSNVLDLARSGADVAAVVSMHGNLQTKRPARAGEVKAAIFVAHGANDPIAPKADRDAFEAEMSAAGARWAMMTFGGVHHSFTDSSANRPPVSQYSAFASDYAFHLAHRFIADAFAGKFKGDGP